MVVSDTSVTMGILLATATMVVSSRNMVVICVTIDDDTTYGR
jgi:hypothetical protein